LPLVFGGVTAFYTLVYKPDLFLGRGSAHFMHQFFLEWLEWFLVPALFALPTILTNSISYFVLSKLNWVRFWNLLLLSVLANVAIFFILTLEDGVGKAIKTGAGWGSVLAFSSVLFFYLVAVRKSHKILHKQKSFRFSQLTNSLVMLSLFAFLIKLFVGSYYPASGTATYLAIKPSPSFTSVFHSVPQNQLELLKGKNAFLGYEYFDMIFLWAWWLLPAITGTLILFHWLLSRTK
jgi:hypothetical protein